MDLIITIILAVVTKEGSSHLSPGSRLTIFYRDASSALLQLSSTNGWILFTHVLTLSVTGRTKILLTRIELTTSALFFFFLFSSLISLIIADGPHHYYHPACGHKGSSHLSPVHALRFFIAMQVQQLVNQWLDFIYPRSHAFRYRKKEQKSCLTRIELTTSALFFFFPL